MPLQGTDLLVVHRPGPGNGTLYSCPVDEFLVDANYATELQPGIVRFATVPEIIDGGDNQLAISPANLAQAFLSPDYVFDGNSGNGDTDYDESPLTFLVEEQNTPVDASETEAGIVRLATAAETEEGTVTTAAITPAGLRTTFDSPTYTFDAGSIQLDANNWDYPNN